MYGDLCGRDFTIEQMTLTVTLPDGEGETTGYIYVEIDTSSEDVITLNSALAPFTPTYEDINTNGAVAQMVLAEYTASAVAVTSVTPVYPKATAGSLSAGSVATVENAQAVASHSAGDYILLGGKLYLVTAAVSVGETFVEGTNIEAAVIGDALTALNNGLTSKDWQYVGVISSTSGSVALPTGWKEIGVGMTLKHSAGGYAFYTMSKLAIELANAGKLVFGGYNFGCTLKYNSTAQALTYDNYYSSTVDLYFRVYVKM
jgi:hypothetical protein